MADLNGPIVKQKQVMEEKSLRELQKLTEHLQDEKAASEMKEEWHYTMRVFDRLFFVVFFLIWVGFITCIFLVA